MGGCCSGAGGSARHLAHDVSGITASSGGDGDGDSSDITWNFEKFLVDGAGNVVKRYPPPITPEQIAVDLDQFR